MNKTVKKLLVVFLATLFIFGTAGCNRNSVDNTVVDETNLRIMILNRGYGVEWLNQLATMYESEHPGINVDVSEAITRDTLDNSVRSGASRNDIDLYFDVSELQTASLVDTYSSIDGGIYDISALYSRQIPGEDISYGEKMNTSVRTELQIDGKYYSVPWATATLGIFYNETVLNNVLGNDWEIPNTSDELLELGDDFLTNGGERNKFFLYAGALDLIGRSMFLPWWAQYEGTDNYELFWQGIYDDEEDGLEGNSVKIYTQLGRLKALEALEPLCRADNGYAIENAAELTADNYKRYQTRFFTSEQGYALYPCGDWLEQESATGGNSVVKMMKLPIISSIVEKCPSIDGADNGGDADAELSALIDAIDAGISDISGDGYNVTQDDYDYVYDARHISTSMSNFHIAYIPAYANAKSLAEDFLLFMASDRAISTYKQYCKGGFLPFTYQYENSELTELERSVEEVSENAEFVYYSLKNPLFYKGGIFSYTMTGTNIDVVLNVSESSSQYMTAREVYDWFINYYSPESGRWESALSRLN